MPYISKAAREAALYITLLDLCTAICHLENCGEADALVQLRNALADGELRWAKWGDGKHLSRRPVPRIGVAWWLTAKIRIPGDGKVWDDDGVTPEGLALGIEEWRTLLIYRDSAARLWRLPPAPSAPPAAGPAESGVTPSPLTKEETEAAYKRHIDDDGYRTEKQDLAWGKERGIRQSRVRELRARYPRPPGRPKQR